MSKKTKFIVAALAIVTSSHATADDKGFTVTLAGDLDTQFGYISEKIPYNGVVTFGGTHTHNPNGTTTSNYFPITNQKYDRYGVVNDTRIRVKADGHHSGFKYGGLIVINADTSNSKFGYDPTDNKFGEPSVAHQTMMYVENCMGRIEAGSYTGAYAALKTGATSLARATGGIDGDWQYWINTNVSKSFYGHTSGKQLINPNLLTSSAHSYTGDASKVTYYTPTWHGLKAGISYIPDTQQHGTITNLKPLLRKFSSASNANNPNQITSGFTDVFQGGIGYTGKLDKVSFQFSALGEVGKAKKVNFTNTQILDRKDLASWELGVTAHYMCFGIGGSYGDLGKSGQIKSITDTTTGVSNPIPGAKSGKYWSLGANYIHHNFGASAGYFTSKNGGFGHTITGRPIYGPSRGKVTTFSFGVDYKLATGFMPYAEYTNFNIKDPNIIGNGFGGKNCGAIFLAGSKLHF